MIYSVYTLSQSLCTAYTTVHSQSRIETRNLSTCNVWDGFAKPPYYFTKRFVRTGIFLLETLCLEMVDKLTNLVLKIDRYMLDRLVK